MFSLTYLIGMDPAFGREAAFMFSSFFWKKTLVRTGIARFFPSVKRLLGGGEQFLHYLGDRALSSSAGGLLDPAWFPDMQAPDAINLAVLGSPRCRPGARRTLRGVNDRRACPPGAFPNFATKSCCGTGWITRGGPESGGRSARLPRGGGAFRHGDRHYFRARVEGGPFRSHVSRSFCSD